MTRTAAMFAEESNFFPIFKANIKADDLMDDTLIQSWTLFWFKSQNITQDTVSISNRAEEPHSGSSSMTSVDNTLYDKPSTSPSAAEKVPYYYYILTYQKEFYCKHCSRVFTTFANMKRHEKLHSGEVWCHCHFSPNHSRNHTHVLMMGVANRLQESMI
jgi:hypothetical protein